MAMRHPGHIGDDEWIEIAGTFEELAAEIRTAVDTDGDTTARILNPDHPAAYHRALIIHTALAEARRWVKVQVRRG